MNNNWNIHTEKNPNIQYVQSVQQSTTMIMMRHDPPTGELTKNLDLCCLIQRDKETIKLIWKKTADYKNMLIESTQDLEREIQRVENGGHPPGDGSGSGSSGKDATKSYWDFLKMCIDMVKKIILKIDEFFTKHKFLWKELFDIIITFLTKVHPKLNFNLLSTIESNYALIWELLIKYFKENKKITLEDIINLILTNVKGGIFNPILDAYTGIKERNLGKLIVGSIKLVLNLFALAYGGTLIPILVNIANGVADISIDGVASKNIYDILKGIVLIIIAFYFNEDDKGVRKNRCILL